VIGGEKRKWNKRGLSKLKFGQNRKKRQVTTNKKKTWKIEKN
jgi:hypothetical protein